MLRTMTADEVAVAEQRRMMLWVSDYVIDGLTALLMDPGIGGTGMTEVDARQKADMILRQLGLPALAKKNRDWTLEGQAKAAKAHGVLE